MWGLNKIKLSIGLVYNAHRLIWLLWAYDFANTEVEVRYRSMCNCKMYAIICKENTEPLTKRMEHVSLHIIQKSNTWLITCIGMFSVWGYASSRKSWPLSLCLYTTIYTNVENWITQFTLDYGMDHTWNGCFMYMAYSFVNHQMEQGFECVVTQLLSHSSIDNLNTAS